MAVYSITPIASPFEWETALGANPHTVQLDASHFLLVYEGPSDEGFAIVHEVDGTGVTAIGTPTQFYDDAGGGVSEMMPVVAQGDSVILVAHRGVGNVGVARALTVDGSWNVATASATLQHEALNQLTPDLIHLANDLFCLVYRGDGNDGFMKLIEYSGGSLSAVGGLEFDTGNCNGPCVSMINDDPSKVLVVYDGNSADGWAKTFDVNAGTGTITELAANEHDPVEGRQHALAQLDANHFLVVWTNATAGTGHAQILEVNLTTYEITMLDSPVSVPASAFTLSGERPQTLAVMRLANGAYDVVRMRRDGAPDMRVDTFSIDATTWALTYNADSAAVSTGGIHPAVRRVNDNLFACWWTDNSTSDGFAQAFVYEAPPPIRVLSSTSNGSTHSVTHTSAAFNPAPNTKLYAYAFCQNVGHTNTQNHLMTGSTLTWSQVGSTPAQVPWGGAFDYAASASLWVAEVGGTPPTGETVTIDAFRFDNFSVHYSMVVIEVAEGYDLAQFAPNKAETDGEGNSETHTTNSLPVAATLGDPVVALVGAAGDGVGEVSTPSGWGVLVSQSQVYTHIGAFWRDDFTGTSVTFTDLGELVGQSTSVLLEFEVESGGPTPQTWTGSAGLVWITGTSGAFAPGAVTWEGSAGAVSITGTSGAFSGGGAPQVWAGSAGAVAVSGASGAFSAGATVWPGSAGLVGVSGASGAFSPGAVAWAGSQGRVAVSGQSGAFLAGDAPQTWEGTFGVAIVRGTSGAFLALGAPQTWAGSVGAVAVVGASGAFSGDLEWIGSEGRIRILGQSGSFSYASLGPVVTGPLGLRVLDRARGLGIIDPRRTLRMVT